ncbi:MAG TPA: HupE/UreJ family protein [Vicinamibacteria bacterium]|nr:HupE/UreJ family protein [Vicinamibacteria bacterium]
MRRPACRWLVALLAMYARSAAAHDFAFTDVRLVVEAEGAFQVQLACDLDALALGVDSSADSAALAAEIDALAAPERERLMRELAELLKRRVRIRFDGAPATFEVALPDAGRPEPPGALPTALGLVARLSGRVPPGAREVSFFASRAFPPVRLTVRSERSGVETTELLAQGAESQPMALAGTMAPSMLTTAWRFLGLGFAHILPLGFDHILFVVGLTLLSSRFQPLLAQVTAFTVAHTATLALSTQGVLQVPPRIVETLIALSIVYVGVENVARAELRWSRLILVFGFGLLHGLGFAGVLRGLGWPEDRKLTALLAFNAGVELGQLAVIGLAIAALAMAERAGLDRRRLGFAASLGIAAAGLYLAIERGLLA